LAILSFYPYNIQSISIHQEKKQLFQSSELQPWKNFRNPVVSEFDEISERSAISKFLWGPQNVQGAGSQRNN